jgi:hypothetical protein
MATTSSPALGEGSRHGSSEYWWGLVKRERLAGMEPKWDTLMECHWPEHHAAKTSFIFHELYFNLRSQDQSKLAYAGYASDRRQWLI